MYQTPGEHFQKSCLKHPYWKCPAVKKGKWKLEETTKDGKKVSEVNYAILGTRMKTVANEKTS